MGKLIEPVVERWAAEPLVQLLARNARQLCRVVDTAAPEAIAELSCEASGARGEGCVRMVAGLTTADELSQVSPKQDAGSKHSPETNMLTLL